MQFANCPHEVARLIAWFSDHRSDLPIMAETFACILPAFRMKYAALGCIFSASGPRSTALKMQLRTTGATFGRPRRLASANHEPPDPAEDVPEEKLGISLDICGPQSSCRQRGSLRRKPG